jgi:hypothetical protein
MIYAGCKQNCSDADDISSSRSLLILYATETGTAQDTADRIARECRRIHFTSRVLSMHAYQPVSAVQMSVTFVHIPLARSYFAEPCYIRRINYGLGDRTPFYDLAMEKAHPFRSPERLVRRLVVCCVRARRHLIRKVLLAR